MLNYFLPISVVARPGPPGRLSDTFRGVPTEFSELFGYPTLFGYTTLFGRLTDIAAQLV